MHMILIEIFYQYLRERIWEAAERRTRRGAVDAVAILAKVMH